MTILLHKPYLVKVTAKGGQKCPKMWPRGLWMTPRQAQAASEAASEFWVCSKPIHLCVRKWLKRTWSRKFACSMATHLRFLQHDAHSKDSEKWAPTHYNKWVGLDVTRYRYSIEYVKLGCMGSTSMCLIFHSYEEVYTHWNIWPFNIK